jgi:hypothetical protein
MEEDFKSALMKKGWSERDAEHRAAAVEYEDVLVYKARQDWFRSDVIDEEVWRSADQMRFWSTSSTR